MTVLPDNLIPLVLALGFAFAMPVLVAEVVSALWNLPRAASYVLTAALVLLAFVAGWWRFAWSLIMSGA
jgi:uncharacterized membrane protein YqjE